MGRIGAGIPSQRPGWILAALAGGAIVAAVILLVPRPRAIHAQERPSVPLFRYVAGDADGAQGRNGTPAATWSSALLWMPFRAQARRFLTDAPGGEIAAPQAPPVESAMLLAMRADAAASRGGIYAEIGRPLKLKADVPSVFSHAAPKSNGDAGSVRRGLQVEWGGGLAGRPLDVSPLLLADWPAVSKSVVLSARMRIGSDGRVSSVMLEMPSEDPALDAHAVRLLYRCALPPGAAAACEGTITLQPPLVPAAPAN